MNAWDEIVVENEADHREQIQSMTLSELAAMARRDWRKVYFGAVPYLEVLSSLATIDDSYGADGARTIIIYFLSNASSWRGEVARQVKKELKRRAGIK